MVPARVGAVEVTALSAAPSKHGAVEHDADVVPSSVMPPPWQGPAEQGGRRVRAGCGLAARHNASGQAQSVRGERVYARTSGPLPCRSAASPHVDRVGSALLRGPQCGVSAMATGDARDTAELHAR